MNQFCVYWYYSENAMLGFNLHFKFTLPALSIIG